MTPTFTIVIPTFNRKARLLRTIRSAYQTGWPGLEIIVVDDASSDGTEAAVRDEFPEVRYLRLDRNSGPGAARNRGLQHASNTWAVLMDDDDLLLPDSLAIIAEHLAAWPQAGQYPCVQFSRSNGSLDDSFRVVQLQDYLHGRITGDFVPVINCDLFRQAGLAYPDLRIGGEHLLWFRVAQQYGIPTWTRCVATIGSGERTKLCSTASQLRRPEEYAALSARTLDLYGDQFWNESPKQYWKYAIGTTIYFLLAANRKAAWDAACCLNRSVQLAVAGLVIAGSAIPTSLLRWLFRIYRYSLE